MVVFGWEKYKANAVMLEAHTQGMATAGVYEKEQAETYVTKLTEKGLIAMVEEVADK